MKDNQGTRFNCENISRYISAGRKDLEWYRDCQNMFADLFGEDKVRLIAQLFAATSINTSLKSNITLFRRALYEIQEEKPFGRYLPNIKLQLERIRKGEELSGRKIRSFANAMSGDVNAVVVDIWLLRAFEMDRRYFRSYDNRVRSGGATDRDYNIIEAWVRHEAKTMNVEPRQLSAMIWSGVRITQGGGRTTRYEGLLRQSFNNLFNVI